MGEETREFSRVPFHMVAQLRVQGTEYTVTNIRDVSMSGIFLEGEIDLELETHCEVILKLEGSDPSVQIEVSGLVQRVEEGGCGIRFTQIPLESYDHLNQIVQLNATNPSQSEKEILSLRSQVPVEPTSGSIIRLKL